MKKSLGQIQEDIDKFCEERKWINGDPNQLITSIIIELGELSEHYQWENKFKKFSKEEKKEVGYEFVDILFYLCRLASKSEIDIEEMFYDKLPKLDKKFKNGQDCKKANSEYRKIGKNRLYE
jgi:NTP pyrophosphatase (non-canonical NTP hydrolase)